MPAECRAQPSQEQWAGARDGAKLRHFPYFQHEKTPWIFFSVAISSITRFSPALLALLLSSEEKKLSIFPARSLSPFDMFSHSLLKRFARDDLITFEFLSAHNTQRTLVVEFFASRLRCSDHSNVSHSHTHFQWCWAGDWKVLNGDQNDRRRSERDKRTKTARATQLCFVVDRVGIAQNKRWAATRRLVCCCAFFSARAKKKEFSVSKAEEEVSQFRGLFDGEEFVITVDDWPATASRMRRNNWNCVMIVCTVLTLSSSSSSHWKQKCAAVSRDRREANSEPVFCASIVCCCAIPRPWFLWPHCVCACVGGQL